MPVTEQQGQDQDLELTELLKAVAGHINWDFKIDDVDSKYDVRRYLVCGPHKIYASRDNRDKSRLNFSTGKWPEYSSVQDGHKWIRTVFPSSVKHPAPATSIAAGRGAHAIAQDLKRRFISIYETSYAACLERATEYQKFNNSSIEKWNRVCDVLSPYRKGACDRDRNSLSIQMNNGGYISVENRSGDAHLQVTVPASRLAAVMEALSAAE